MANNSHRKRGGAFHLDDDSNEESDHYVQFVTPYYDEANMPDPLDLSKLCLDGEDDSKDGDQESSDRDRAIETRGRRRSRSVHEKDFGAPTTSVSLGGGNSGGDSMAGGQSQVGNKKSNNAASNADSGSEDKSGRKGGPLQYREVQALQKGLEEANQSINRNQNREDEEERMAADAEKRKHLLLSNNLAANSSAEPTRQVKLLILGDIGVGKSSLIMRWTLDTFSPSLQSSVDVNFKSRKVHVANELMQVQVWDTAGQEQFHKITTSYYKGAQGIMLVYDVTDPASLANIEYWIKNIKHHASDQVQVALVGNKTDLRGAGADPAKRCCETEHGQKIAGKYGIPFFETSAKDSENVEIAFLTLVEHIALGGSSGAGTHSPGTAGSNSSQQAGAGPGNGLSQSSSSTSSSSSAGGNQQDRKSIVEKSEKSRFLGVFKNKSSSSGKSPPPIPPATGAAVAGSPAQGGAGAGPQGANGEGSPEGEDKEKCIIS